MWKNKEEFISSLNEGILAVVGSPIPVQEPEPIDSNNLKNLCAVLICGLLTDESQNEFLGSFADKVALADPDFKHQINIMKTAVLIAYNLGRKRGTKVR